ncbi:hypothetical protein CR162_08815 [Pseudoroseomonas rhizosphaerae]|uniref:Esterase n=1 Tax=Teichococcus rhizosphaerae TaxID=1335062 RepID=A0A2C6Y382_9PROT|nr:alpha/beta fold hydrolase [Pseudoroseomonas rhizosphaerae]PHK95262.1 hypothetical protein CR162_08815 [Pseudoroseomonas rhizosphaerae]
MSLPASSPQHGPPVALPRTTWWDMPAGPAAHRIFLAWPEAPPPPAGYPVLLLLDANAGFATAVDSYRALTWRDTPGRPAPALILGLGQPGDRVYDPAARQRDYTPAAPGSDAFLRFIEAALLPALARRHPIDQGRLALFGHSLGGLFALHALLARPGLFQSLVIASPSLWWNEGAMLAAARRFAARLPPEAARTRLLVTVGGLEESDEGPRGAIRAARRMIGNARDLAALLRGAGLSAEFAEFAGEDHGSARLHALLRAPRFAISPAGETA